MGRHSIVDVGRISMAVAVLRRIYPVAHRIIWDQRILTTRMPIILSTRRCWARRVEHCWDHGTVEGTGGTIRVMNLVRLTIIQIFRPARIRGSMPVERITVPQRQITTTQPRQCITE